MAVTIQKRQEIFPELATCGTNDMASIRPSRMLRSDSAIDMPLAQPAPSMSFFSLPQELRDEVYELLIDRIVSLDNQPQHRYFTRCTYPQHILRINKQIHHEFIQRLCNLFHPKLSLMISSPDKRIPVYLVSSPVTHKAIFKGIPPPILHSMRRLDVFIDAETSGPRKEHWPLLFQDREVYRSIVGYLAFSLAEAQRLETLTVTVEVAFSSFDLQWMEQVFLPLKRLVNVRKIQVRQMIMGPWDYQNPG